MTDRIRFLRQQTLSNANKTARKPLPNLSTANEPGSIPIRKARAFQKICETMPLFIGEQELIVGTRTFFTPHKGNEDGHDHSAYTLFAYPPFVNEADIARFGGDFSGVNGQHHTPDYGILLQNGIGGLIQKAENRKTDPALRADQIDFLDSLILAYKGLASLITRYADYAAELAETANDTAEQARLYKISAVCRSIAQNKAQNFYEAVQLFWFAHLAAILENSWFINYGRIDVVLSPFKTDTSDEEARELLACLLLKFYDQADIDDGSYLDTHQGQLVATLGGVLPNGENAVDTVTMLILDAIDWTRLPEPEFNLRISSKNPPEYLDRAAELTVSGCNFVSYYNDDRIVEALIGAGMEAEYARDYGFDLCQDLTIPGKGDLYLDFGNSLAHDLMRLLDKKDDFSTFEELLDAFKAMLIAELQADMAGKRVRYQNFMLCRDGKIDEYLKNAREQDIPQDWDARHPMCPLPYLSGLFHGSIENAVDMIYECYPVKFKGGFIGTSVEAINSLAAIKQIVYEKQLYTLKEVVDACKNDYQTAEQEIMRSLLWNAPKWGNDDDFVDLIAKDLLECILKAMGKETTGSGKPLLTGIHQPHPVATGWGLMATPEGRHNGKPVAVTMTPESGTMKNGATAALKSASKLDPSLLQWNFCLMINYYASIFAGKNGKDRFKSLLSSYFARGGVQHQPNVLDAQALKDAQQNPEKYKDLIVRLWGVSAHFVDLPKELQDEMIARLS